MMRVQLCVLLGAVLSGTAFGQSTPLPAFEIADVHASAHSTTPFMSGGMLRAGRYELRKATMVDLIRTAYSVEADHVLGGPSWLETDRFDVIAKAPAGTPGETIRLMLRSLLADRFKLVLHNENRPLTAYLMTAVKGKSKLKETDGSGSPGCQPQPPANNSSSVPMVRISCRNITMDAFATSIHAMAGGYLTNPVVNSTGLQGAWDFDLHWTPRGALAQLGADGISVFDAVEKQLGLKLDLQKVPMPVIVVDSANQKPTDNPPGVITKLPPAPPAEFEVAVIKASQPGATPGGRGFLPGGRIEVLGVPLKLLVSLAWNLGPGEELTGAPKWLDSDAARYDLIAKVSSSALIGAPDNNQPPVDIDDMRVMIRALLAERFQLKTHYEDRPAATYTLVGAKPKLKTADPSNRTGCKTGPAPLTRESGNAGPVPFQVTCQNITMKQFAEQLQSIAPFYLQKPVTDATGIEGSWDLTFQFNFVVPGQGGGRSGGDRPGNRGPGGGGAEAGAGDPSGAGGSVPTASDPMGGVTIFEALTKQLGLKLEMQKRPMPVLVIDHILAKPTDN